MSTVGQAKFELLGDNLNLSQALSASQEQFEALGKKMESTGKTLSKNVTAPIVAVGAAVMASAVRLGNMADALLDMEAQTGLSTTSLQEFRRVAVIAGVSQDTIANSTMMLTRRLSAFGEESTEVQGALGRLGVEVRNADGSFRDMDDVMPELIRGLSNVENETERASLATAVFGRSAMDLVPVLDLTAEQFDAARQEAHDLGLVLGKDALRSANEFRIGFDTLKQSAGAVANEIGMAAMPVMTRLVGILQDHLVPMVRSVARAFDNLSPPVQMIVTGMLGLAAAIGPVMVGVGKLIPLVTKLFALIAANPVGLLVVALGALVIGFVEAYNRSETFRELLSGLVSVVVGAATAIRDALGGALSFVVGAFQSAFSGIFGFVADMVGRIVNTIGAVLPAGMRDGLKNFHAGLVEGVSGAVSTAQKIINELRGPSLDLGITGSNEAAKKTLYGPVIEASAEAAEAIAEAAKAYNDALIEGARLGTLNNTEIGELIEKQKAFRQELESGNLPLARRNELTREMNSITEALNQANRVQIGEIATSSVRIGIMSAGLADMSTTLGRVDERQKEVVSSSDIFALRVRSAGESVKESLSSMGGSVMGVIGSLNPMGAMAKIVGYVLKDLAPFVEALQKPMQLLGEIVAKALMPILEALFPVFKFVAIIATYLGQALFAVAGGIQTVVGGVIRAIGNLLSKIPGLGGTGRAIASAGQSMMDVGAGFREAARGLGEAREAIRNLEWPGGESAIEETTAAVAQGAEDVVGAIHDIGMPIPPTTDIFDPDSQAGMAPMTLEIGNLNIDARGTADPVGTGQRVAQAFVEAVDRALGETTLRETRLDGTMVAL
jgi:phage-related protein